MSIDIAGVAEDRIGTRVGNYDIDALIGCGGMGNVYRARAGDGTTVAVKIAKPDYTADETFRRRFIQEAQIASTVSNPHLVQVLDSGEDDGLLYMAAEFIDGPSLETRLKAEGRLDVATTVRICAEAGEGLEALWSAGMIHRDVKPGNILFDRDGEVYVTDFGLAKNTLSDSVLTLPGQSLGTLAYMAPEQIRGEPVTAAADIYSLGCVMFECLQGRPPFGDRQGMRVLWAHLQDEPPDLSDTRPEISAEFTAALKSALRKEPAERPASATEYAEALACAAGVQASRTIG